MWTEASAVGHGYAGPAQCALQRPLEVTMAGEAQATPLGVAQSQSLDGRNVIAGRGPARLRSRLLRAGLAHAGWPAATRVATAGSPKSVGPTWMLVPI